MGCAPTPIGDACSWMRCMGLRFVCVMRKLRSYRTVWYWYLMGNNCIVIVCLYRVFEWVSNRYWNWPLRYYRFDFNSWFSIEFFNLWYEIMDYILFFLYICLRRRYNIIHLSDCLRMNYSIVNCNTIKRQINSGTIELTTAQ